MDIIKDYPGNALAITDTEVAQDWRLGFCRAVARVAVSGYPSLRFQEPSESRFGGNIQAGLNEHIEGARRAKKDEDGITVGYDRTPGCAITEVYQIREETSKRYNFDTYGGDDGTVVTAIFALASCACGKIVKQSASTEIPVGAFMAAVANADND